MTPTKFFKVINAVFLLGITAPIANAQDVPKPEALCTVKVKDLKDEFHGRWELHGGGDPNMNLIRERKGVLPHLSVVACGPSDDVFEDERFHYHILSTCRSLSADTETGAVYEARTISAISLENGKKIKYLELSAIRGAKRSPIGTGRCK